MSYFNTFDIKTSILPYGYGYSSETENYNKNNFFKYLDDGKIILTVEEGGTIIFYNNNLIIHENNKIITYNATNFLKTLNKTSYKGIGIGSTGYMNCSRLIGTFDNGCFYSHTGDITRAVNVLEKILEMNVTNLNFEYSPMGGYHYDTEKMDTIIEKFNKVLDADEYKETEIKNNNTTTKITINVDNFYNYSVDTYNICENTSLDIGYEIRLNSIKKINIGV